MWKYYLLIFFVIFQNTCGSLRTRRNGLGTSNLPFRYELEQVTSDFQENLRKELSNLEMEMYTEFLQFLQEIDGNQTTITDNLTNHLSDEVNIFLEKFTKVMVYSSERIENLKESMNSLTISLGNSVREALSNFSTRLAIIHANKDETSNERSKRHTVHLGASKEDTPSQDLFIAKKMLEMDPDDLPVQDDPEFTNLDSSSYFDGHVVDKDSDFMIREILPRSRFVIPKKKAQDETEVPLRANVLSRNCYDLLMKGFTQSGVYVIYPSGKGEGREVWCEQTVTGGGWTVLMRRQMDHMFLNFTRIPIQYIQGFGIASSSHWIGLEVMHQITQGISNTLHVHMHDNNGTDLNALYEHFSVGSRKDEYSLEVGGYNLSSTAPDALTRHSGKCFSFPLPRTGSGCSQSVRVGWWYLDEPECYQALPTLQEYSPEGDSVERNTTVGLEWEPWKGITSSVRSIQLMVRPSFL